MSMTLRAKVLFVATTILLLITSCSIPIGQSTNTQPSARILFIGNSFTTYNGGIDQQLQGLASSIQVTRVDANGYTLENHWNDGKALRAIHKGGWNYVVLQEQSQTPILNQRRFYDYASYLDGEIKGVGATSILLMTWERPDSVRSGVTTANLEKAFNTLAKNINAQVAPVGSAFARSRSERPSLALYAQDGHPTIHGTYLAAGVIYATIFGTSPVGNSFSDGKISAEERTYLQRIAAEMLGY